MDEASKKEALSHKQWLTWIHSWWGCTEIKIMWTPFMMNTYSNAVSELEFSSLQLEWNHNAKPKWHNQRETTKVHETKSKWKSKAETKWSNPEQNSQHVFWVKQKMFCWKTRQNQYRSTKEFSFNKSVFLSKMQNLCFKNSTTSVNSSSFLLQVCKTKTVYLLISAFLECNLFYRCCSIKCPIQSQLKSVARFPQTSVN